MNKLLY